MINPRRATCQRALPLEPEADEAHSLVENPYAWLASAGRTRYEWMEHKEPKYVAYADSERAEQLAKLHSFSGLQRGWDSYDAEPPSELATTNATRVLHVIWSVGLASPIKAIVPSVEGGISIVFSASSQKCADIECFNDGEILALTSESAGEPSVWSLNGGTGTLRRTIERISAFLNG